MNCLLEEIEETKDPDQGSRYRCVVCGRITARTDQPSSRIVATCKAALQNVYCGYRSMEPREQVSARRATCGRGQINIYECDRFEELVTLNSYPLIEELSIGKLAHVNGRAFEGRSCSKCSNKPDPALATILHITPYKNWQQVVLRGSYALHSHGLNVYCLEMTTPSNVQKIRHVLNHSNVRIVFNHAFTVDIAEIERLAKDYPSIKFVTVSHSQENHLYLQPQMFRQLKAALQLSEALPNAYYAGSKDDTHWHRLGYDAVTWKWPCYIPKYQSSKVDPPVVLVTSRGDVVKALCSQIIALALIKKRDPSITCAISLGRGMSDLRQEAVNNLIEACRLECEFWDWAGPEEYLDRLRHKVSIVLQPSMTETFNYVSMEAGLCGRPWVGSMAIKHTPMEWRADPNSPTDMARIVQKILDNYEANSVKALKIAESVALRNNDDYAKYIGELLLRDD